MILEAEEQDYDDVHLKIPNLKNYDGREGRRKSSIVVDSLDNTLTGTLTAPSGGIKIKDGNNQVVINRADINKIFGSASGQNGIIGNKVALYSSGGTIFSNTFAVKGESNNNFIILRSRNPNGWRSLYIPSLNSDATFVLDQTNQTINGDKTFSRAITMTQEGSANNHLVTKSYVDLNLKKSGGVMAGPITMNGHDLIGLPDNPRYGYSAVNRNYVNAEIAKIPNAANTSNFLKKDGSVAMTGDLNMNEQRVKNTLDPTDEQDTVNKRYLESQLTDYLKRDGQNTMTFDLNMNNYKIVNLKDINSFSIDSEAVNKKYVDNFLKKDGSVAMTGNLNMATNKIKNLGTPSRNENDEAVNVQFFNSELNASNQIISTQITTAYKKYVDESHVTPSGHFGENAFLYLMEDVDESSSENNITVSGIVPFYSSIHQINKNAYRISLVKDSGSNNYRSRIGFNLGSLSIGYYTFVCEFFPSTILNVSVTALGTTISINKQTTKTYSTYAKTVVQFHRWNSTPPQFIYLDLHGSETSNNRNVSAHLIVYGVKGYFPDIPSSVFDQIYVVNNGRMTIQTDLDLNGHSIYRTLNLSSDIVILKEMNMNNQKIINVADGTSDKDVVNKKQMENFTKYMVHGSINIGGNKFVLNGSTDIIMPYRNITSIFFVYKTYNSSVNVQNLPRIGIKIEAGNTLNLRTSSEGVSQQIVVNQTMSQSLLSVELTGGPIGQNRLSRDRIIMLIELAFHL